MKTIFGIGSPSKIKQSGVVYVDKQNGNRYIQTKHPFGNEWLLLNDDLNSVPSSTITYGTEMPAFNQKFTITESEIGSLDAFYNIGIGFLAPNDGSLTGFPTGVSGLTFIKNIYSRLNIGDPIIVNAPSAIYLMANSNGTDGYYSGTWEISTDNMLTTGQFCKWTSSYGTPANYSLNFPHNGNTIQVGLFSSNSFPLTPTGANTLDIWITYIFVPFS